MYESPITVITQKMQLQQENEIMKAVKNIGVFVDKEELIKALAYDRDQYNKGFQDGLNSDKWIPVEDHLPKIDEEVLVQDLFENIFVGKIYDPEKHNGKFGSYFIDIQTHCVTTGVAWMKKPSIYKKGE